MRASSRARPERSGSSGSPPSPSFSISHDSARRPARRPSSSRSKTRSASLPASTSSRPWRLIALWAARCSGFGHVELVVEDRVARGIFVHVGGAMADPLARHEDRQLHVVLDLAHLERRRVTVPHEIVDEAAILADLLGAAAVAHPRGLHDGGIVAHVVDDADEAVIEHGQRLVEDFLQRRGDGRRVGWAPARAWSISACWSLERGIGSLSLFAPDFMGVAGRPAMGKYPGLTPPSKSRAKRLYRTCRETDYGDKRRVA